MPRYDRDDGTVSLCGDEYYHVSGYVTVKVRVSFNTSYEPDESGFDDALAEAVADSGDWEIEDSDDLDYDIERD